MYLLRSSRNKDPPGATIRLISMVLQLHWTIHNLERAQKTISKKICMNELITRYSVRPWRMCTIIDVKLIIKWDERYGAEAMITKPNFHSRLCRKFDCRRNAQIRGKVRQADLREYVHTRHIENLLVNLRISSRIHVTDVSRQMQDHVHRHGQSHLPYRMQRCLQETRYR